MVNDVVERLPNGHSADQRVLAIAAQLRLVEALEAFEILGAAAFQLVE